MHAGRGSGAGPSPPRAACRQHGGMRATAYRRNARGLRDRQAFEDVRMQAGELFAAGHSPAEVARTLGVARQSVSRWHARWQRAGRRRWQAATRPGTPRAAPGPA
jgi:DNA invertase Pin-like site-specific DNA recombinase